jgi:hypothetical protein
MANGVTTIGNAAFSGSPSLTYIEIPIDIVAFALCSNLTLVKCLAETPLALALYVFYSTPADLSTLWFFGGLCIQM